MPVPVYQYFLVLGNYREEVILSQETQQQQDRKESRFGIRFLLTFILLFPVWLLYSGKFDLFHIILGVISCALVAFFSADLAFTSGEYKVLPRQYVKFALYLPWLLYQVFLANIHVMYLVFHPRMMDLIDPGLIEFRSRLKSEKALTTFANSITLTPGTITVYATEYAEFRVHVIDKKSGESLPGEMETRIAKVFDE